MLSYDYNLKGAPYVATSIENLKHHFDKTNKRASSGSYGGQLHT
jgi:hypothetical protein